MGDKNDFCLNLFKKQQLEITPGHGSARRVVCSMQQECLSYRPSTRTGSVTMVGAGVKVSKLFKIVCVTVSEQLLN